ncbi:MAG: DUF2961 domain-containing protein [Phycisphaerae bacterium]|nr:DUF2961 domain-containing protein [Phycisphaerae bacterium]
MRPCRLPCRILVMALFVPLLRTQVAVGEVRLSYSELLSFLTDLNRLPVIEPGVYCRQFSSYDRRSRLDEATGKYIDWEANGDSGQYIRVDPDTQEGVMADMEGPGCIVRIWSANPQGVIRFYLDGDTKPTYEWDFVALFRGEMWPFIRPLVWCRDPKNTYSAADCYLPIPFAKSCKVTSVIIGKDGKSQTPRLFYHIDYRTFPKGWQVDTFKLPLTSEQQQAVSQTAAKWAGGREERYKVREVTVEPGETLTVEEIKGPAVIVEFRAKLMSSEKWAMRKVLLKAYWDGAEVPSINCPIGDFFGEPKDVPYRSYPMEISDQLNACFFPMPFHKSAKILLINEGRMPAKVKVSVGHLSKEVPENWGLFHAKYRQQKASTTFDYSFIEATGAGKFVGVCLFPDNIHGGWWGEGDEKVWVDGEKFPSWFGTGSEDYFGDAGSIRHFTNPLHGHPQKVRERMQGCYRWHMADNIPFYRSFRMTMEDYAALPLEKVKNDYYSVAYWYQLPGGSDTFEDTPVSERIPRVHVQRGAIEAENCVAKGGLPPGMTWVDDEDLPQELSAGRGVKLVGGVGSSFTFAVPSNWSDRYVPRLGAAPGVKGSSYELLVNGQKLDKYAHMAEGPNSIGVRFTGAPVEGDRCELIVDYFQLNRPD